MDPRIDAILQVWFEGDVPARWFTRDAAFDEALRRQFDDDRAAAATGALDHWAATARGALALVVLLDQLPRNLYRNDPRAFAQDPRALAVTRRALADGLADQLSWLERYVLLMPFMHAEDRDAQRDSVAAFRAARDAAATAGAPAADQAALANALDYAERHAAIVERFGRYPHRNAILDRPSTDDELAFLAQPGSSF
jgi:uncharacterized protein (DUF924 family)